MSAFRERIRHRLPLLLAAFVFALGGLDALGQGQTALGCVYVTAALVNLGVLAIGAKAPPWVGAAVSMVDAAVAFTLAWFYWQRGTVGLHWAWAGAGLFFLGLTVLKVRRGAASS
ncbi:MAG TPA: hypothetical protein VKU40_01495 [Thermoanaerobaculia bacterium]|nr:hypothetical protein [Thermoanaerobaculia bacterium]